MKKTLYILSALLGMVAVAEAQIATDMWKQDIVDGVSIENLRMERNGGGISKDKLLGLSSFNNLRRRQKKRGSISCVCIVS